MSFELDETHDDLTIRNPDHGAKPTDVTGHQKMFAKEVRTADAPFKAGEATENSGERDFFRDK